MTVSGTAGGRDAAPAAPETGPAGPLAAEAAGIPLRRTMLTTFLLSGALFPSSGASPWIRALMTVNPLSYGVEGVRLALYGQAGVAGPLAVTAVFAAVMMGAGVILVRRPLR